jgi:hypothetical protein
VSVTSGCKASRTFPRSSGVRVGCDGAACGATGPEVECLRRAITACRSPLLCVASEFDQARFLRVQLQAELGTPLSQCGQTRSGVDFSRNPITKSSA